MADDDPWADNAGFLSEVMMATYEHRRSQVRTPQEVVGGCVGLQLVQGQWPGGGRSQAGAPASCCTWLRSPLPCRAPLLTSRSLSCSYACHTRRLTW